MKKLLFLSSLLFVFSCTHPSLEKDGGTRIILEASVGDLLREFIVNDDSVANGIVSETVKEYAKQEKLFLDLYFSKLEKASLGTVGKHFDVQGLNATSSTAVCKLFFEKELSKQMDNLLVIIAKRIDKFGVQGSSVIKGNKPDRILVEIPGKVDVERLRKLLQCTSKLEFWETYDNEKIYQLLSKLNGLLAKAQHPGMKDSIKTEETELKSGASLDEQFAAQKSEEEKRKKTMDENPFFFLFSPAFKYGNSGDVAGLANGPMVGFSNVADTAKVNTMLNSEEAKLVFGHYTKFLWTFKTIDRNQKVIQLIAIKTPRNGKALLSGNIITDARIAFGDASSAGQLSVTMTKEASLEWKRMTANNIGYSIAIVLDDLVYSYPIVNGEISGGITAITGNFTIAELDDFANVLKAGSLPLPLKIVQEDVIAPFGE